MGWGNESLFKRSWSNDPRWPPCPYIVKTLKNLLLRNQKADDLETCMYEQLSLNIWDLIVSVPDHCLSFYFGMLLRVLEYYQVCSNDDPGLTLTYFTARPNLVLYGKKVKQWIFQKLLLSMT